MKKNSSWYDRVQNGNTVETPFGCLYKITDRRVKLYKHGIQYVAVVGSNTKYYKSITGDTWQVDDHDNHNMIVDMMKKKLGEPAVKYYDGWHNFDENTEWAYQPKDKMYYFYFKKFDDLKFGLMHEFLAHDADCDVYNN